MSPGTLTSVCVCEPRQVCTAATCFGLLQVGDVEDADAAEALAADPILHALEAAVDAAARLLHRHHEQIAVNRDVALAAGAGDRGDQLQLVGLLDVVGVEAVEVADEQMPLREGEVGVGEVEAAAALGRAKLPRPAGADGSGASSSAAADPLDVPFVPAAGRGRSAGVGSPFGMLRIEETGRLRQAGDLLQVADGLTGIVKAGLEADARIGQAGRAPPAGLVLRPHGGREQQRKRRRQGRAAAPPANDCFRCHESTSVRRPGETPVRRILRSNAGRRGIV